MTIQQKREAVAKAYPGEGWSKKVQKMGDHQIHALYMRLMNANKLS